MTKDEKDDNPTGRRAVFSPILSVDDFRPLSSTVRVAVGATSHCGISRKTNEDHYLVIRLSRQQETLATSLNTADLPPQFDEHGYAMLVADGLGEGGAGSVASRVALSALAQVALHFGKWSLRVDAATASDIFERAERFYAAADAAVLAEGERNPLLKEMATALTVAYSAGDDLFVAHVGHTRAYLFRDGALTQLTRDHTIERHMADTHRPVSIERRAQDLSHILTDAVGARGGHPMVEVERFRLQNGDQVLLCTNGLTDMLSEDQIAEVLALRRAPRDQCAALTDLANQHGGKDNITIVIAQYQIPRF
jgi:PPM family protein phosphatase